MGKQYQVAFLINPVSGDGRGLKVKSQLPEIMRSFGYLENEWKVELTEKSRLEEQTREILNSSARVIAVGGDGTMGLVLNQLRLSNYQDTHVGLIPLGTGNDLARILGIYQVYKSRGLLACIKRLIKSEGTNFNLWNVGKAHTLSAYISMGMDAAILHAVDKSRHQSNYQSKAIFNKFLFLWFFISRFNIKTKNGTKLTYHLNGQNINIDLANVCSCIIANINSYGGGSYPSAKIDYQDGKLDILIFRNPLWYFFYMMLARIIPSMVGWCSFMLETHQAEKLEIYASPGECLQIDGEPFGFDANDSSLQVSPGQRVTLLDLKKSPFNIF